MPTLEQRRRYARTAYLKKRTDPVRWAAVLKAQRKQYRAKGRNHFPLTCLNCESAFTSTRQSQRFCSKSCASRGERNGRWKGGRLITLQGYVKVFAPGHPYAVRNLVPEHRVVMEQHLGRYLLPSEVVHHQNHNKQDNRLRNLVLMTNTEHSRQHSLGNRWKKRVLTPQQETEVFRLWQTGQYQMSDLAKQFCVGTHAIFASIHRQQQS